jgi:F0F1-type ATP synthase assembly protein I
VAFLLPLAFDTWIPMRANAMNADIYANLRLAAWRDALRVLFIQLMALVIVSVVAAVGWGIKPGLGALIGAGIGLIANAYFAVALLWKPLLTGVFGDVRMTWSIKVALTLALMWIAMRANIAPPPAIVAGFVGTMVAQWLAVSFWLRRG